MVAGCTAVVRLVHGGAGAAAAAPSPAAAPWKPPLSWPGGQAGCRPPPTTGCGGGGDAGGGTPAAPGPPPPDLDLLFAAFHFTPHASPGQRAAAGALEARGWRFHGLYGRWFRWPAGASVVGRTITATYDRGPFLFFEPELGAAAAAAAAAGEAGVGEGGAGGGGAANNSVGSAATTGEPLTAAAVSERRRASRRREAAPAAGWVIRRTAPHFTFSFQYLERGGGGGGGGEVAV
jgi:hypothetical protein